MADEYGVMIMLAWHEPSVLAEELRRIADIVEERGVVEMRNGTCRVSVRRVESQGGEMPMWGRYHAVGYDGEDWSPPVAMFLRRDHAEAHAAGAKFDPEDLPSDDGIVVRADVVGFEWNSYETDLVDP